MKASKIIIGIMLIALMAVGCKTTKTKTSTDTKAKAQVETQSASKTDSTGTLTNQKASVDKTQTKEAAKIKTKETEWSKPDSMGKQYPVKTKETETDYTKDTKNDVAAGEQSKQKTDLNKSTDNKVKQKASAEQNHKAAADSKTESPSFVNYIFGALAGVIAILFLIDSGALTKLWAWIIRLLYKN